MNEILLSVICPTLNEEFYIEKILQFFISSNPKNKELIIIDGGSTDNTCKIVNSWISKYDNIHLIFNSKKYVPYALNLAIPICIGNYIVRLDAHTEYSINYFEEIINTFNRTNADIVGGPMRPIGKTLLQRSIAIATSNSFGVGNSKFHNITYEGYSDSVYLGAWKSNIFKDIGYFDINLIRNQDDEFHFRAVKNGKKIYLNPSISSFYYPRSSLKSLFIQYFQYGLFKPKVLLKNSSGLKIWHMIPFLFVIYLLSLPFAYIYIYWIFPLLLYIILNLIFSIIGNFSFKEKICLFLLFPLLHISYGSGFLLGLIFSYKKFINHLKVIM